MIISPYIFNYGSSAYDLRKVAMYSDDTETAGWVLVRFINVNDVLVKLPKDDFETQYQLCLTAGLTATNVIIEQSGYTYYGSTTALGSWRVGRSGNNIIWQRLDAIGPDTWVTKNTVTA